MSGPKRNPDKLNTIGVVVVGICGAVMVYVTIVALQAFYMNDTSDLQTMKDYGGQDQTAKGRKADELRNITDPKRNGDLFTIPIDHAMKLVVEDVKKDPAHLVPALPKSEKPTVEPTFGRPTPLGGAAPAGAAPTTPAGTPAPAEGASAPGAAPMTPTGTGPVAPAAAPGAGAAQPTGATPAPATPGGAPAGTTTPAGGATPATPAPAKQPAGGAAQPGGAPAAKQPAPAKQP